MYSLALFGGAAIVGPGGVIEGPAAQPRRLGLLALLALANPRSPMRRDRLVAYLWPETTPSRARHLLSVSLHALRRALGEDAIWTRGDALGLNTDVLTVDVLKFSVALEEGDHARAVHLYAGPLLDGFFVSDVSPEFELWVETERRRFASEYRNALEQLATVAQSRGRVAESLQLWTLLATHDPDSTRGVVGLMRAHAALGDTAAAARAARAHADYLRRELGVEPDPAVSYLLSEITRPGRIASASPVGPGVDAPTIDSVTILDFWADAPSDDEWLGTAIAETLRHQLVSQPSIRVLARDRLALAFMERQEGPQLVHRVQALDPAEVVKIGRATGARWVVGGTYTSGRAGTDVRVAPWVTDVAGNSRTKLAPIRGQLESLPTFLGQLTTELLRALDVPASSTRPPPRPETTNLDAYEHCARATQCMFEFTHESLAKALHHLERAIDIDPDYVAPRARIAGLYAHLHEASNDPRHLEAGEAAARAALEREPDDAYALMMLSYALWRRGDHAQAAVAAMRSAELAPMWHIAHLTVGTIFLSEGIERNRIERCVAAVEPAARAALLEPDELLSQLNLPWLYMYFGQYELARPLLDNAVRAERAGRSNFRHHGGLTLRAMLHRRQQEWDEAVALLDEAVERYEHGVHLSVPFWMALTCCIQGDVALQRQRVDDSVRWFRRAAAVADSRPRNLSIGFLRVRARLGLATAFARLVMTREAAAAFAEARAMSADRDAIDGLCRWEVSEALMHFDFARYHAAAGQREDMAAELEAAVAMGWSDAPWLDADVCFARFREDPAIGAARAVASARAVLPDYRKLLQLTAT